MGQEIPLGLLYSVTGTYGAIGRDALDGARLALNEINGDENNPVRFRAIIEDPGGSIDNYHVMSEAMLRRHGCRHIVGTITSIARKEVIPTLEKHDALLWYVLPYEGFEICENVIYTGASPNQHILPLFAHMLANYGLFPWLPGEAPMPLIALLGSELPGRLEWALSQSFSAHVMKPIQSSGVFSALVIAFSNFEAARDGRRVTDELQLRLGGRAAVIKAVVRVMQAGGFGDDEAYARIRSAAMSRRITVEDFCAALSASMIADLAKEMPRMQRKRPGK